MIAFLESPMAIQVATRDAQMRPAVVRGWGVSVEPDRQTSVVYLSEAQSEQCLANIRANGACALNIAHPVELHGVQLKGAAEILGRVSAEVRDRIEAYRDGLFTLLGTIGFERSACLGLWHDGDFVGVRLRQRSLFDQTPGEDAGAEICGPWQRL